MTIGADCARRSEASSFVISERTIGRTARLPAKGGTIWTVIPKHYCLTKTSPRIMILRVPVRPFGSIGL
ncbi:hypothetical protein BGW42_007571 [Actinomortierella wolfii]|nr:hypothetical protein BGW42_007571 [Actinomortierella wolfii]